MALEAGAPRLDLDDLIRRAQGLEADRSRARAAVARVWLSAAAGAAAVYLLSGPLLGPFGGFVFPATAFALLVWALLRHRAVTKPYREAYKRRVLAPLVEAVLPGFRHEPHAGLPQEVYLASRLFPARPDRYASEDRFSGAVAGVPLTFAEVHAEREHEDCDKDGCRTEYVTIFKGLLAVAEFPKAFSGTVLVYPDRSERLLGPLSQSLQRLGGRTRGLELIRLEDPGFERRFVVFADDPVAARYVLSTRFMEALRGYRGRHGPLYAAVIDGTLYLALPTRADLFEPPPLWRRGVDVRRLERYAGALATMRAVVSELDLDVRIWGARALSSRRPK
ncbi:galanin [Oceanithermus profundus DSM 14977]|uniref:Galanin n=1 Tax=Oceanithermus profundus (strain DSM 14977 / NBRC 100410 / VKM B-2274 / 506) TaxID=670487 RepID=E4U6A0_OCEP5|nr:DUF3137 domain-containing protein [Oceanithermus profundus]ADR35520.1 galanin [Oceanithermus profundus DSM 14977]